jgi:hypothetical protein
MKKIIYLSLVATLFSCNNPYKYKIEGVIKSNGDTLKPAIAYTDSIYGQNEDSIWYYNSDGSKLTLLSPYKIYKIK